MRLSTGPILPYIQPQGRLTLTTAVPVLITGVAAAATVFYTPYQGNLVPIWNGIQYVPTPFTELSNILANSATGSAGPAAAIAASNYDLFVWSNSGVLTLTRGPLWTSDSGRGTGAGTTQLTLQNGAYVNTVAITNGPAALYGTYVGTVRTDAGGATVTVSFGTGAAAGGIGTLGIWNCYNRTDTIINVRSTDASWTYATAAWQAVQNSATWRGTLVRGLNEDDVIATYAISATLAASIGARALIGVALDVTTPLSVQAFQSDATSPIAVAEGVPMVAQYAGRPGLGFHFLTAIEFGASGTTTFNSNTGGGGLQIRTRY